MPRRPSGQTRRSWRLRDEVLNAAPPTVAERTGALMSSPSQPAHLSNHQRNTLRQIFQHPAGHNIEWRAVLGLLGAVGSAEGSMAARSP